MSMVAMLLASAAFGAFGLATDEHHRRATGRRPSASVKARWRSAAWLMLGLSFAASIVARGWSFGPVWWIGFVMLAAGAAFLAWNLAAPGRSG